MKQECFYVGWNGSEWTNFANLHKNQQEALVYKYLIQTKLELTILIIHNKFPVIHNEGPEHDRFIAEPLQEEVRQLRRTKESGEYLKKSQIVKLTLDKYLNSGLPSNNKDGK